MLLFFFLHEGPPEAFGGPLTSNCENHYEYDYPD